MHAGGTPPHAGGFTIQGTNFDDVFDVSPADGQWVGIEGEGGNDVFNIGPDGLFTVAYWYSPSGVVVDLGRGTASNDGHGDIDTINGHPFGVSGSDFTDVLRGSDRDESFTGRSGNDTIDGGGGTDTLRFGTLIATVGNLHVDLEAGTATGTWGGSAFSYTLSNIERVVGEEGDDTLMGNDEANRLDGGAGNDVLNPRDVEEDSDVVTGSTGNDRIVYTDSGDTAYQWLDYANLHTEGIRVTVNGERSQATVNKGAAGTDTIVDVTNPLNTWGFGVGGTAFDDVYHVDLVDGQYQYMEIQGRAGNDTFNVEPGGNMYRGGVSIGYWDAPSGVNIDLAAGTVQDGYGSVDTVNGNVSWVYGSPHADVIRGSDNDEEFRGNGGDDAIDGRGGFDILSFSGSARANSIEVDLGTGTAKGSLRGSTFTHTISNIERAHGGNADDTFRGSSRDEEFRGRGGEDQFIFEAGHGSDTHRRLHRWPGHHRDPGAGHHQVPGARPPPRTTGTVAPGLTSRRTVGARSTSGTSALGIWMNPTSCSEPQPAERESRMARGRP